ncbi:helix-turn-helix domain-containing protein [Bacterioplanoides sp. SCSIO 12839]|uniref:helix-turn-helix domain-containing protein n=1 Tax=Bacterioplanoides sp. SCSIO 12839 TaxID=2829569 RepID=UPI002105BFD6|nr:helix-turn-helix domain-containing protein [Bacterioplanoides sp. SCSIO 12839]UTW48086.1 helix-turn-helix domain-containing protein [Bacterioplanoides sp. SCSIO 12839]
MEGSCTNLDSRIRSIETSDPQQLSAFQSGKGRQYTQIRAGDFRACYTEINLDGVQLFSEKLNVGTRIQGAPDSRFVPFGAIMPNNTQGNFCGFSLPEAPFIQATGGVWDVTILNHLDYVSSAFNAEYFHSYYEKIMATEVPKDWIMSRLVVTDSDALTLYRNGLKHVLYLVAQNPDYLIYPAVLKYLSDLPFKLIFDALGPTLHKQEKIKPLSKRLRGVRKSLEYIEANPKKMLTVPEVCAVSGLSERSLQYGFQELLGMTPVKYLRLVRLNGSHQDLLAAQADSNQKVVDIALKWGFVELGRFAREYQMLYNELPSQTLRQA